MAERISCIGSDVIVEKFFFVYKILWAGLEIEKKDDLQILK